MGALPGRCLLLDVPRPPAADDLDTGTARPRGPPGGVKCSIVLSVTACLTLWTYDTFVRSTAVGALLNGRRHPRGLPRSAVSPPPSQVPV